MKEHRADYRKVINNTESINLKIRSGISPDSRLSWYPEFTAKVSKLVV